MAFHVRVGEWRGRASIGRPRLAMPLAVGAAVVVLAGIALRFWGLSRQSYWGDELFTVEQASGGLRRALAAGSTEVHTPFYASLLSQWVGWGPGDGTTLTWTRLMSALLGALAVPVAWISLRGSRLSAEARALAVATIAASGFAIVYSQEARSYSLLFLAATGLTATTVVWALAPEAASVRTLPWIAWVAWAVVASLTHLFGLVLALGCAAVLVVLRRRWLEARLLAALALIAALPEALWMLHGRTTPGFAGVTSWITAPGPAQVADLMTSTFAAGTLRADADGFPWVSPWGVAVVVLLLASAFVAGRRLRATDPTEESAAEVPADARAAAVLLLLAGGVIVSSLMVSQAVHLWTLRNMIVVVPALSWGLLLLVLSLAGPARQWLSGAILLCLAASLVLTGVGLQGTYKNDYRGALEYLAQARAESPDLTIVLAGDAIPRRWYLSTDEPVPAGLPQQVFSSAVFLPRRSFLSKVRPLPGPVVYVMALPLTARDDDPSAALLLERVGGPDACSLVPLHGVAIVRCGG